MLRTMPSAEANHQRTGSCAPCPEWRVDTGVLYIQWHIQGCDMVRALCKFTQLGRPQHRV